MSTEKDRKLFFTVLQKNKLPCFVLKKKIKIRTGFVEILRIIAEFTRL